MSDDEGQTVIDEIAELIEQLELSEGVFRSKIGGVTSAHSMIINEIGKWWMAYKGMYLPKFTEYGIDFIGRENQYGKIILSVEVDRGSRAQRSWSKLADIRSENKIWIYFTNHPKERAEERFKRALEKIREFLEYREEDVSTLGRFATFLKTPQIFKFEWLHK